MSNNKIEENTLHPLVSLMEENYKPAVEFQGFLGKAEKDTIRLYSDLQMSSYVEISKTAVLHWEKDEQAETGRVKVFVNASSEVTEVHRSVVPANISFFSITRGAVRPATPLLDPRRLPEPTWRPRPEPSDLHKCIVRCRGQFASLAERIRNDEIQLLNGRPTDESQFNEQYQAIQTRKAIAKDALWLCLNLCRQQHPRPPLIVSIRHIYETIVSEELERPEP